MSLSREYETTTKEVAMFSQEGTPDVGGIGDQNYNPFGVFEEQKEGSDDKQDSTSQQQGSCSMNDSESVLEEFINARMSARAGAAAAAFESALSGTAGFIAELVKKALSVVCDLVKKAVKMAVFKFAIEFCALGIKTLVESMLKMELTPPNIDTAGVYYNFQRGSSGPPPSQNQGNRSSYDNPFSSPFSAANGW